MLHHRRPSSILTLSCSDVTSRPLLSTHTESDKNQCYNNSNSVSPTEFSFYNISMSPYCESTTFSSHTFSVTIILTVRIIATSTHLQHHERAGPANTKRQRRGTAAPVCNNQRALFQTAVDQVPCHKALQDIQAVDRRRNPLSPEQETCNRHAHVDVGRCSSQLEAAETLL